MARTENPHDLHRLFQLAPETLYILGAQHGLPIAAFLKWKAGRTLRVESDMVEVGLRKEVGRIVLNEADSLTIGAQKLDLPRFEARRFSIQLLSITENGQLIDSGLRVQGDTGPPLDILPGDFPYTLFLQYGKWQLGRHPEYEVQRYIPRPLE